MILHITKSRNLSPLYLDKNDYVYACTDDPLGYFKQTLRLDPQVGQGIASLIAALAPLIASLIFR